MNKYYFKANQLCNSRGYLTLCPFGFLQPNDEEDILLVEAYSLEEFNEFKMAHPKNILMDLRLYDLIPNER